VPLTTEQAAEAAEAAEAADAAKDIDFVPDMAVEDDESSLMQADEPTNAKEELNELATDADMSMDALLAMYPGYGEDNDADGEEDDGDGEADDGEGEADGAGASSSSAAAVTEAGEAAVETSGRKRRRGSDDADVITRPSRRTRSAASTEDGSSQVAEDPAESMEEMKEDEDEDAEGDTAELLSPPPQEKVQAKADKANKVQPMGPTRLHNPDVKTKVPYLLKATLRPYQHVGLDWLANMSDRKLNGILADEMGLGKTIQTIALLAHQAVEKGNWGPHLIIVPTSVMLNWEIEFKKFCPAFKILTYYGSIQKRKDLRKGWSKPDAFHVCITSYKLAVQDHNSFRRKKWRFMVLDEAHQIKNFESKRWQTLLGFSSKRRLLLTGTPLQNNLMELWSLMHFLMPQIFQSHAQFKEWFGAPVAEMVEGRSTKTKEQQMKDQERVHRLHTLLRPFLLRRLKKDVETQLPAKHEHVIKCSLSTRQRQLYDDFMSRSNTKESLRGGNYLTVVNVLMQLRKVCNHPNLFQEPTVQSPFVLDPPLRTYPSLVLKSFEDDPLTGLRDSRRANSDTLSLALLNLCFLHHELHGGQTANGVSAQKVKPLITELDLPVGFGAGDDFYTAAAAAAPEERHPLVQEALALKEETQRSVLRRHAQTNQQRSEAGALYGQNLLNLVAVYQEPQYTDMHDLFDIFDLIVDFKTRQEMMAPLVAKFSIVVPKAICTYSDPRFVGLRNRVSQRTIVREDNTLNTLPLTEAHAAQRRSLLHTSLDATRFQFPDRRLIQYDCGKLQTLETLLRAKRPGGHRVLIFTQMSRVLDILEQFLNYHAFTYLRLDGSTPINQRQRLMDRFNMDKRIFVFILSTRSGGIGINLTGADTVVFYDSDWNPTMDAQAQDRCHRIGQTREVNIYRLVSERTVEENILKKAQQKRMLGDLAIESGSFNTDFFNVADFFDDDELGAEEKGGGGKDAANGEATVSQAEIAAAMANAEDESDRQAAAAVTKEVLLDEQEFDEAQPFPEDPKYTTSASEGEGATEDELQVTLKAQLEALQGIEKHSLTVLLRYLEPAHQARLEQARQAILEKDQQLKDLEAKIKEQEELESEDDDELFYDKDEAYAAYMDEALKGQKVYAPPNPSAPEEVYVEPAHAMQYRVGYLAFAPLPKPDRQKRFRKKRDKRSSKQRFPDGVENRYRKQDATPESKGRSGRSDKPLSASQRYVEGSLFRRYDKDKQPVRHPIKRPFRMLSGKEKREVDSNKDAPHWLIDEDFTLLQIVRTYLNPVGTINWHLVADAFNTSVSFTGRYRSTNQCRDRYFRVIMPREEGKDVDDGDESHPSKKRKEKHGKAVAAGGGGAPPKATKSKPPPSTDLLRQMDRGKALLSFHTACFTAAQRVAMQTRKPAKLPKASERHASHDKILQSITGTFPATGPFTPAQLSQMRVDKEKQLKEQQQQQAGQARVASGAAQAAGVARMQRSQMQSMSGRSGIVAGQTQSAAGSAVHGAAVRGTSWGAQAAQAAAAAAASATAAAAPKTSRSSTELAQLALNHFKQQEARALIYTIYKNPQLDEATKVVKLTAAINSLNQQYAAVVASQKQAAQLAAAQRHQQQQHLGSGVGVAGSAAAGVLSPTSPMAPGGGLSAAATSAAAAAASSYGATQQPFGKPSRQ